MRVEIYTDGAAINNGSTGAIGYAAVVLANGDRQEFFAGEVAQEASSNLAELKAIQLALRAVRESGYRPRPLLVFSDSEWSVKSIAGAYQAKTHLELIREIRAASRSFDGFELSWLRGHVGHKLNERAHYLANRAANEANQKRCEQAQEKVECPDPFDATPDATVETNRAILEQSSALSSGKSRKEKTKAPRPAFVSCSEEALDAVTSTEMGEAYLSGRGKAICRFISQEKFPAPELSERLQLMSRDYSKLKVLVDTPPPDWTGAKRREMRLRLHRWSGTIHGIEWVLKQRWDPKAKAPTWTAGRAPTTSAASSTPPSSTADTAESDPFAAE